MRCCRALLCIVTAGLVAGCGSIASGPNGRTLSEPPSDDALQKSIMAVARTAKWGGVVEASPVRHAHPIALADWIVCAQSGARDHSPPYAMFFNGDTMVSYRLAVQLDDCWRVPYAPAIVPSADELPPPMVIGR
jgi:hypothetical protein